MYYWCMVKDSAKKKSIALIFSKLDAELIDLLEDLKDQPDHVLNEKPIEGKWSVLQTMYHLILTEELSLQYVKKKLSYNPELNNAGIKTFFRRVLLNLYADAPLKFKAPVRVNESNMPDEMRFWEVVKKWKDIREETKEYLNSLPNELFTKEVYKHPFVGKLTLKDMLNFFDGHFHRHKKQINRTMKKVRYIV